MEDGSFNATMDNSTNSTESEMDGEITPEMYFFSVFNVIGLVLNVFVLVVVTRPKVIPGKIPLTFLVNQLVSDMLGSLVRSFTWATNRNWVLPDNVWSTIFCKFIYGGWLYWTIALASLTNLVLLNIERYISVVHSKHHSKFTPKLIAFLIVLSYSLGVAQNTMIFAETIRVGSYCIQSEVEEWWPKIVATSQMCLSFVIPLTVIIYCNTWIILVLRQQSQKMRRHGSNSAVVNPSAAARKKLQRELSVSVCILGVVFLVTNAPISITYTLNIYGVIYVDYDSWFYLVLVLTDNCFYLVNPLVCLLQMKSVRRRAVQMLSCFSREKTALNIINYVSTATAQGSTRTTGNPSASMF